MIYWIAQALLLFSSPGSASVPAVARRNGSVRPAVHCCGLKVETLTKGGTEKAPQRWKYKCLGECKQTLQAFPPPPTPVLAGEAVPTLAPVNLATLRR